MSSCGSKTSYSLLSCLAALLLIAPGAQAQTLRGVVQDESTGVAIEGALLLLLDGGGDLMGTILSDETGAFLLRAAASGRYSLRAERLGYATYTSQPISLADGAAVRVQLRLGIDAIPLEALTVLAGSRSRLGRLVGFDERRNDPAITGFFLDSEDLERRPAASPSRPARRDPGCLRCAASSRRITHSVSGTKSSCRAAATTLGGRAARHRSTLMAFRSCRV